MFTMCMIVVNQSVNLAQFSSVNSIFNSQHQLRYNVRKYVVNAADYLADFQSIDISWPATSKA